MAGALERSMLALKGPGNEPLAQALRRVDGDPSGLVEAKREDVGVFSSCISSRASCWNPGESMSASPSSASAGWRSLRKRGRPRRHDATPCRVGKSHAPEEWTDREALAAGEGVMFEIVSAIDRTR
jgi:hypothetical protein